MSEETCPFATIPIDEVAKKKPILAAASKAQRAEIVAATPTVDANVAAMKAAKTKEAPSPFQKVGGTFEEPTPTKSFLAEAPTQVPLRKEMVAWEKRMPEAQREAFEEWTADWDTLREYDRTHAIQSPEKLQSILKERAQEGSTKQLHAQIMRAFEEAPSYEGPVYRGLGQISPEKAKEMFAVGNKVEMDAMSSFSKDLEIANSFAGHAVDKNTIGVILRTEIKTGGLDLSGLPALADELEVLVRKGKGFHVVDVGYVQEGKVKKMVVTLKEIPEATKTVATKVDVAKAPGTGVKSEPKPPVFKKVEGTRKSPTSATTVSAASPPPPPQTPESAAWVHRLSKTQRGAFEEWVDQWDVVRMYDKTLKKPRTPAELKDILREKFDDESTKQMHARIMKGFEDSPAYNGPVYRGMSQVPLEKAEKMYQVGNTVEMEAVSSFTKDIGTAFRFAEDSDLNGIGVLFRTEVSSGSIDLGKLSTVFEGRNEMEVLVRKGKVFKVVDVGYVQMGGKDQIKKVMVVTFEEVP